jgi:hypothetical protein
VNEFRLGHFLFYLLHVEQIIRTPDCPTVLPLQARDLLHDDGKEVAICFCTATKSWLRYPSRLRPHALNIMLFSQYLISLNSDEKVQRQDLGEGRITRCL